MSLPTIPFPVRIVEAIWKFTQEAVFGGGVDVTGAAVFRGPIRSQNGVARWIDLGTPATAAHDSVAASVDGHAVSNAFTVASPDVPRNATATFGSGWNGGDVTITGTDINGSPQNETITNNPGSTVAGVKIFTTVTAAAKATQGSSVSNNTCTLGAGTKLGVLGGFAIGPAAGAPYFIVGTTIAIGALDVTNQGVDCSAAPPDSTHAMAVLVNQ